MGGGRRNDSDQPCESFHIRCNFLNFRFQNLRKDTKKQDNSYTGTSIFASRGLRAAFRLTVSPRELVCRKAKNRAVPTAGTARKKKRCATPPVTRRPAGRTRAGSRASARAGSWPSRLRCGLRDGSRSRGPRPARAVSRAGPCSPRRKSRRSRSRRSAPGRRRAANRPG